MRFCVSTMPCLSLILSLCFAQLSAQNVDLDKTRQPVAMVDGQPIYYEELSTSVRAQLLRLRSQEYEIDRKALETLIEEKLLSTEAARRKTTTANLLDREVNSKVSEPTEAELQAYYLGQKDRLNRPFDDVKDQLREALKQARTQEVRQQYLKALRKDNVLVLLAPPKVQVAYDPSRLRGNPRAPVMIVEFSDFQCPYCRQSEQTLKEVLERYREKVSLAYRDLPLTQLHPQAELAAEASRCAGEQGKFWEYHDQLFSASNLQRSVLLDYARSLKIDEKQFDSCLSSEKYKLKVQQDLQDGTQAGISGTPGFFVNGIPLIGAQSLESFDAVIDEELARRN